jgi:hypothetical protein
MSRPDLDALLNALLPFAQQMLKKHGEFFPFGASMTQDGAITLAGSYDGKEHPSPQEVIAWLVNTLKGQASAGQIKAAGICFDVRVVPPQQHEKVDAIQVSLEHISGEAIDVFLPYRKGFFDKITYGELFASSGTSRIFSGNGS